jgi:predicted DNA binding CopG/RHH family protein
VISARDMHCKESQIYEREVKSHDSNPKRRSASSGKRATVQSLSTGRKQSASLPNLKPSTQSISLRLPVHTLERIKVAANARDVPYRSLIKVWLEERLSV